MPKPGFSTTGFLASASQALQTLMGEVAKPHTLTAGTELFAQGDTGDTLYAVSMGALEVSVQSAEGTKLTLQIMQPGDILGEISLFSPGPRTATVTALELTEVWGIRHADMLAALRSNPDLQMDMISLAGLRMRWMGEQLSERVFMDLPTRLARRILHLIPPDAQSLKMSQNDLADFVGASRESVSKTLSLWRKDGIISLGRGSLTLIDRNTLAELSQDGPV